jgi:hypothetical protein
VPISNFNWQSAIENWQLKGEGRNRTANPQISQWFYSGFSAIQAHSAGRLPLLLHYPGVDSFVDTGTSAFVIPEANNRSTDALLHGYPPSD